MSLRLPVDRLASLMIVVACHALALYGLWQYRLIPSPQEAMTLFVSFVALPVPTTREEPRHAPELRPRSIARPPPRQVVAAARVLAPAEHVASPHPSVAAPEAAGQALPAAPMPLPPESVTLSSELSVACPERSAPAYPAQSRRLGETGLVVLRVELNEAGHVALARVDRSSGYARLDEAALSAVRTWRCTPAIRNGRPVHAIALQPFNFILNGN